MLHTIERILAQRYQVTTALSAGEALTVTEGLGPELAILDIRMPKMDGFKLLGRLREIKPDLDVIFMTGIIHELDAQLIRSIREKAFYFVQKPFDREVLLTLVERCLELRRLAAENRRHLGRLERELEEARGFQRSLLPRATAFLGGVDLAAIYQPCTELGGDLYDYAGSGEGRATVLIADVSGHGVSAAMLTAIVKSSFHDTRAEGYEPLAVVRRISRAIGSFEASRFVTVICARLCAKDRKLEYVNAGHPNGLLWNDNGDKTLLPGTGPLISPVFPEAEWEQRSLPLATGDKLFLYTDGVTETLDDRDEFGEKRLFDALQDRPLRGQELMQHVLSTLKRFSGARPAADDRTLLTATITT